MTGLLSDWEIELGLTPELVAEHEASKRPCCDCTYGDEDLWVDCPHGCCQLHACQCGYVNGSSGPAGCGCCDDRERL